MARTPHRLLALAGVQLFQVAEESMGPALKPGDGLVTVRLWLPRRGRIVVFDHPDRPGFALVKRIVGLPGERVAIVAGALRVDDVALSNPWGRGHPGRDGTWDVPPHQVFVLSDARELTRADSREFGPIAVSGLRRVVHVSRRSPSAAT
ncbi:MAG: signal peptidase I [Microthrixaceae bacterium]